MAAGLLAVALGLTGAVGIAAPASAATPQLTEVSAEFVETSEYAGVYVGFTEVGVVNATDVELRLNRADGTTYSIHAKESVLTAVNATADPYGTGGTVITLGERTSGSWDSQVSTWAGASILADTDPVAVLITLGSGEVIEQSIALKSSIRNSGIESNLYPPAPILHVDPYFVTGKYKGVAVDIKATNVTDATQVRVTMHRSVGGDVVKVNQPSSGSVLTLINSGTATTAPIVVQQGSYDEAGSSSWVQPVATWTAETLPTGLTVEILRGDEVIVEQYIPIGSIGGPFASLEDVMPVVPSLRLDPYFVGSNYQGFAVDINATNAPDADEVRVTVERAVGGPVVKTSKPDAAMLAKVQAGEAVTAPIVIQQGSYNEAGSTSWVQPDAVWTAETLPTSVTVDILDDGVVLVSGSFDVADIPTHATRPTLAEVMPALPAFTTPSATFWDAPDGGYKGIAVQVDVEGLVDATEAIVQVDRQEGGPVIKRATPKTVNLLNSGAPRVTSPIVIQPGTYNETGSSSWFKPVAAWSPETIPTSVTITIKRAYGPDLVKVLDIDGTNDVMPTLAPAPAPVIVEIPAGAPTYQVDVPADVEDVKLDLGTPNPIPDVTDVMSVIPAEVVVTTSVGANVTFVQGTAARSGAGWNGIIELPKVKTDAVVPAASGQTTTVGVAIQMGSSTARIDFDQPVKLVLAGQAGKSAGYIDQGGTFYAISTVCPAGMPGAMTTEECAVDDGSDLVIWTTHFTTFVSYTSTATPSTGGGGTGGGGSSSSPSTGGSGSSGSVTSPDAPVVLAPAAAPTTTPTAKPTTRATTPPKAAPAPKPAPTADAEVTEAAAAGEAAGGFDPMWLIIILVPLGILVIGGAAFGIVRARQR